MKKGIIVTISFGVIMLFGTMTNLLNFVTDVSASKSYCPESKDGSQADPACLPGQSKQECKDSTDKNFKCVKQPERPPPCEPAAC